MLKLEMKKLVVGFFIVTGGFGGGIANVNACMRGFDNGKYIQIGCGRSKRVSFDNDPELDYGTNEPDSRYYGKQPSDTGLAPTQPLPNDEEAGSLNPASYLEEHEDLFSKMDHSGQQACVNVIRSLSRQTGAIEKDDDEVAFKLPIGPDYLKT